jgi:hypothetical protein
MYYMHFLFLVLQDVIDRVVVLQKFVNLNGL